MPPALETSAVPAATLPGPQVPGGDYAEHITHDGSSLVLRRNALDGSGGLLEPRNDVSYLLDPTRVLPLPDDARFDEACVVSARRGGTPLQRTDLAWGPCQLVVISDETAEDIDERDPAHLGRVRRVDVEIAPGTPCRGGTWQPTDLDGDGSDELLVFEEYEGHEGSGRRSLGVMCSRGRQRVACIADGTVTLARTSYHPLMAKLVFGMSQSLDGYVDDAAGTLCMPAPRPALFRHFIDVVAGHAGAIYGRRIYEVMRYWDVDRPEWDVAEREFAAAWQRQPKWIASRTLASVGPNATLIRGDLDAFVRDLKATVDGELDVAGPELAAAVAPLIDEYQLYFRPYVLGGGKPYFAGARPPLRLVATDRIGEDVVRLTYVPA